MLRIELGVDRLNIRGESLMLKNSRAFSGFSVNDLMAAKEFYEQSLGLDVNQDEMGLMLKLSNNNQVFVYEKPDHTPASFTILNFIVEDINSTIGELSNKGVTMEKYNNLPAPQDELGVLRGLTAGMGPDIAWFKDPAGNVLSVLQEA
jgi:predicted enzyme related to lactoylglutathione lyase